MVLDEHAAGFRISVMTGSTFAIVLLDATGVFLIAPIAAAAVFLIIDMAGNESAAAIAAATFPAKLPALLPP